jgi:hypothetical protein
MNASLRRKIDKTDILPRPRNLGRSGGRALHTSLT